MPPRSEIDPALLDIAQKIVDHHDGGSRASAPCWVYVYDPHEEFAVRQEVVAVASWMQASGRKVTCTSVSLADVLWAGIDASGLYDELVSQERLAAEDPVAQAKVVKAVGQILRSSQPLTELVRDRLPQGGSRSAAVLYRAGSLYPGYRTSALLEDLKLRKGVEVPLVLLYPGSLDGSHGLRFMGKSEPAVGYRAMIVVRGEGVGGR